MFWKTELWKSDLGKVFIMLLIATIVISSLLLYIRWLDIQPLQTAHATVISKRSEYSSFTGGGGNTVKYLNYYATFQFSDGSKKEFHIDPGRKTKLKQQFVDELQEGETGTLSYKETKGGRKRFISFEKDE